MLTFLFPRFCLGCGYVGRYLCNRCGGDFLESPRTCLYCKKPSPLGLTHDRCKREKGVDGFVSCYFYTGLLKKIIYEIKYKGALGIIEKEPLFSRSVSLVVLHWLSLFSPLVFQPVPLHKKKEKQRGFNQAQHLAISICRQTGLKSRVSNVLRRDVYTPSQTTMSSNKRRRQNVKGAFSLCAQDTTERNIVLVDDVITSGATVCEAAKILKEGGTKNVFVLALARG